MTTSPLDYSYASATEEPFAATWHLRRWRVVAS
jgi:hypothetical protein